MSSTNEDLSGRVATRFLRMCRGFNPSRSSSVWTSPDDTDVPDYIVQLSEGSSVTSRDVEDVLGKTRDIVRGSCRFKDHHARDRTNRVGFELWTGEGDRIIGEVVINAVAHNGLVTTCAVIELAESARRGCIQRRSSRDLRPRDGSASMSWGQRLAGVLYQVKFASEPEGFGRLVFGARDQGEGQPLGLPRHDRRSEYVRRT